MSEPRSTTAAAQRSGRRHLLLVAAGLTAAAACVLTLLTTGATEVVPLPGIPAPSTAVTWLVPALRLISDVAAVVAVGCLLGAVVLVPGDHVLSAAGYRWVRLAGWAAAVWAVAALASLPVLLANFLGTGLSNISLRGILGFVLTVQQGRGQLFVAVLAATIGVTSRWVLRPAGARILLALAVVATVPPAYSSHSADDANHDVAVVGVAVHVFGVTLWAGGLLALVLARRLDAAGRSLAVARFSALALPAVLLVASSGILSAYAQLSRPGQLIGTDYGLVVLIKAAALLGLAALGWMHRRSSLPALAAGRPRIFLRLAAAELLLFAATIGIAVALGRTAPPPATEAVGASPAASQDATRPAQNARWGRGATSEART